MHILIAIGVWACLSSAAVNARDATPEKEREAGEQAEGGDNDSAAKEGEEEETEIRVVPFTEDGKTDEKLAEHRNKLYQGFRDYYNSSLKPQLTSLRREKSTMDKIKGALPGVKGGTGGYYRGDKKSKPVDLTRSTEFKDPEAPAAWNVSKMLAYTEFLCNKQKREDLYVKFRTFRGKRSQQMRGMFGQLKSKALGGGNQKPKQIEDVNNMPDSAFTEKTMTCKKFREHLCNKPCKRRICGAVWYLGVACSRCFRQAPEKTEKCLQNYQDRKVLGKTAEQTEEENKGTLSRMKDKVKSKKDQQQGMQPGMMGGGMMGGGMGMGGMGMGMGAGMGMDGMGGGMNSMGGGMGGMGGGMGGMAPLPM